MSTTNLFELAARNKVRFQTQRGMLSVEDLWDLPLTSTKSDANLDAIARSLHNELKNDTVSFVEPAGDSKTSRESTARQLKFDIVKHIIDVRLAESAAARDAAARTAQKQRILELVERKREAALEAKSEEELLALLNQL